MFTSARSRRDIRVRFVAHCWVVIRARDVQVSAAAQPAGRATLGGGLAIFDLDRTLIPGSSLVPLGRELVRQGLIRRRVLARHAVAGAAFERHGLDDASIDRVQARLLTVLAGRDCGPLRSVAEKVGRDLAARAFLSGRWLLERHRDNRDFCVILTAAPQELADAVGTALGAHRAIGTRLETHEGRFTGAIAGVRCHGPGKLDRLREEVGHVDWTRTTAYGDSASDLPVLERAAFPVTVNPDRRLHAVAAERGWPVFRIE
jgi:HAD superfamily hydrolase (TIGR01490 family)